ncbi:MAG: MFS transporter [candidate division NC10 bacterium]|nr:MFS transporter [candidate division NC10 bacterium]
MPDPRSPSVGRFLAFLGAMFCEAFAVGVLPPLLPGIQQSLLLSTTQAGLVTAAFGFARLCCDLPAGYLADRIGHRRALLLGVVGITAGCLASAAAPGLPLLLAARGLVGVGHAFVSIGSLSLLLRASPARARGRTTNWMEITAVSGFTAGSLLGGLVGAALGWRGAFLATAAPALLGGVLLAATLSPRGREVTTWGAAPSPEPAQAGPAPLRPRVLGLSVAPFLATFTLAAGWAGTLSTLFPLYGARALGLPADAIGQALSLALLADLLGLTVAGWAADRLGRLAVLLPALGCFALGSGLLPYTRSAIGYVLVGMLLGVVFAAWMMPPLLLAERLPGGLTGRRLGWYRFVVDAGFVAGPVGFTALVDAAGFGAAGMAGTLLGAAALLAAAVGGAERPREGQRRRDPAGPDGG